MSKYICSMYYSLLGQPNSSNNSCFFSSVEHKTTFKWSFFQPISHSFPPKRKSVICVLLSSCFPLKVLRKVTHVFIGWKWIGRAKRLFCVNSWVIMREGVCAHKSHWPLLILAASPAAFLLFSWVSRSSSSAFSPVLSPQNTLFSWMTDSLPFCNPNPSRYPCSHSPIHSTAHRMSRRQQSLIRSVKWVRTRFGKVRRSSSSQVEETRQVKEEGRAERGREMNKERERERNWERERKRERREVGFTKEGGGAISPCDGLDAQKGM